MKELEVVRPTEHRMQKDITEVVKKIIFMLMKGVDTREQLTSAGKVLLKYDLIFLLQG